MTLRICHLADIHLGYRRFNRVTRLGFNQREVDVAVSFREMVDRVIEIRPHCTVIAGDLFHTVRPSNSVVSRAFREIRRLTELSKSPVIIIAGNHESPKRSDTGCVIRLLSEIPGVYVADKNVERFSFPEINLSVTALPHAAIANISADDLRMLNLTPDERFTHNILVTHGQVSSKLAAKYGVVEFALESLNPHQWDYVALGHVHAFEQVAFNAAYSGAAEHTSPNIWVDYGSDRGFLEVHLPGPHYAFHKLTSPRYVAVLEEIDAFGIEASDVMERILERLNGVSGGIEGKILRLIVNGISRATLRQLDHKELRRLKLACFHLSLEFRIEASVQASTPSERLSPGTVRDQLERFCKEIEASSELCSTLTQFLDHVRMVDENRST